MNLIVCVERHWGIGNRGELLFHIPEDQRFFQRMTMGGVVLGGRKTMEGLPGGRPLPGRTNLVLTTQPDYHWEGGIVAHNEGEVWEVLDRFPSEKRFLIGGGTLYQSLLSYCDAAYVTKVEVSLPADTFCPDLDRLEDWNLVQESARQTYKGWKYRFCRYSRVT